MNISDEMLDDLIGNAKTQEDLFGYGGIIKELSRRLMERMLESEMTHQLGYEKHLSGSPIRKSESTAEFRIILKAAWIDTVLGPMIAIADDTSLYLLEFVTSRGLDREVECIRRRGFVIIPGDALPLNSIETELKAYFEGALIQFKTPYRVFGSPFQQQVWQALCQIPFGETRSYAEQSMSLGKPKSYRAVANANGANQLAIIIPCHRVIASDGTLGGYGGGLAVKQWLIEHEKRHKKG